MPQLLTVALAAAMQVGQPSPSEPPNYPPLQNAFSQHGFEGQYEQRHPFDTQHNWVHGYHQEIPAYGGHAFFRPYNYKDVLSQSQTAAGWGMSPTMPYSQQFWHRYHDQATMLKLSRTTPGAAPVAVPGMMPQTPSHQVLPAGAWSAPVILPAPPMMSAAPVMIEQSQFPSGYGQPQFYATPQGVAPAGTVYAPAPR
ncbi:MAG TPA: hypothetical protein VM165_21465 [Planctomycetaceae bacterium]|nr:hypothetical protein [Planctomycetaceae bacterium]